MVFPLTDNEAEDLFEVLIGLPQILPHKSHPELFECFFAETLIGIREDKRFSNLKSLFFNTDVYPDLPCSEFFCANDAESAMMVKLINEQGYLAKDIEHWLVGNPLAQLMYAFIWKMRHRKKLRPLVHGLLQTPVERFDGDRFVLYQLGRHLTDRQEPIVDQHNIRAHRFLVHIELQRKLQLALDGDTVGKIRRSRSVEKQDLDDYVKWINKMLPPTSFTTEPQLAMRERALFWIDKLMYSLGKILQKGLKAKNK